MQSSCLAVLCVGVCRIARAVLILRSIRYFAYVLPDVCFARIASFARRPVLSFCAACIRVLRALSALRHFACRFVCRLVPPLGALRVAPYAPYSAAA